MTARREAIATARANIAEARRLFAVGAAELAAAVLHLARMQLAGARQ